MKIKIKKLHKDAIIPKYSKEGDAGMDLTAVEVAADKYGNLHIDTGLAFEIPNGYVGLIFPRSSICKSNLTLTNSVGVIDSGYRGPVSFKFKKSMLIVSHKEQENKSYLEQIQWYEPGDRIGQIIIMPYPSIEFEEVEELSNTERGAGGFGSTGKK